MEASLARVIHAQQCLRQRLTERFDIEEGAFTDMLFFRSSSHEVSLGRIQELPLASMTDRSVAGDWSQLGAILSSLTKAAVHLLRQKARSNVLSLAAKETELYLGHEPVTVEVNYETTSPGCVILEHSPIVLGIGWLNATGQIEWYTRDSEASCFREGLGDRYSNQLH